MTISIDWPTRVITIPKSFLTFASANTFQLDSNQFRLALKDLEADPNEGLSYPTTHNHNTEVTVAGVNLARVVELINGYTVTFENGAYSVNLTGANTNISDVANFNQVRVNSSNSAGLQVVETRAALTTHQDTQLSTIYTLVNSISNAVDIIRKFVTNRTKIDKTANTLTLFDDDGTTPLVAHDLKDNNGQPSIEDIYERVPK